MLVSLLLLIPAVLILWFYQSTVRSECLLTALSCTLNWHHSWHSYNMTDKEEEGSRYGHLGSEAEGSQMQPSSKNESSFPLELMAHSSSLFKPIQMAYTVYAFI